MSDDIQPPFAMETGFCLFNSVHPRTVVLWTEWRWRRVGAARADRDFRVAARSQCVLPESRPWCTSEGGTEPSVPSPVPLDHTCPPSLQRHRSQEGSCSEWSSATRRRRCSVPSFHYRHLVIVHRNTSENDHLLHSSHSIASFHSENEGGLTQCKKLNNDFLPFAQCVCFITATLVSVCEVNRGCTI